MLDLRPQTSDRLAGCGKSHESLLHCGRAALYRRVSRAKSARALASEAANRLDSNFFRSLLDPSASPGQGVSVIGNTCNIARTNGA